MIETKILLSVNQEHIMHFFIKELGHIKNAVMLIGLVVIIVKNGIILKICMFLLQEEQCITIENVTTNGIK